MTKLAEAEKETEKLRQEPYKLLTNNCIHRSIRLIRECKEKGIEAKFVLGILGWATMEMPILGRIIIPALVHAWVEVEGKRLEPTPQASRIDPWEIRPLFTVRF